MNARERVLAALKNKPVDRAPWTPFVGCHGGYLLGQTATEYLQSADNIVAGVSKAIQEYDPDGIPVAFDLQIEAEALGCKVEWADENPPAVVSHPLADGMSLDDLKIPTVDDGRVGLVMEAARELRQKHPDVALYGLITGPFTLALHLLGTDIFLNMLMDEAQVKKVMEFCKKINLQMADYYIQAGCDVIAIVDPMTSQIGPEQFAQFVSEPMTEIFEHIRKDGALGSFFVCGQAQQNIEVMCQCKPDNVSIDENIPLDYVRDICKQYGISYGGNLQLTIVLLMGSEVDCQRNAMDCLKVGGESGFVLAPGCDLPFATPAKNIKAITRLVQDPYEQEVLETLADSPEKQEIWDMSDYGKLQRVIVDIITLDSESCAPCQYSVEAVKKAVEKFSGIVEWREHKIKYRESVTFMNSLMVKNIPTICIDGKITFVSNIPPIEEIEAAIQKRIYEKLRHKIRIKKGEVLIFGSTEDECKQIEPMIKQAISELGADVPVTLISEEKKIMEYGITKTPAVIVAEYKIKSEGQELSIVAVKEWLKEIM